MVTQLLEAQRQMQDALLLCRAAVEANDDVIVSDYSLQIEPDFAEAMRVLERKPDTHKKAEVVADAFTPNTGGFTTTDPFGATTKSGFDDSFNSRFDDNFGGSGFGQQSAFASDPFGDKTATKTEVIILFFGLIVLIISLFLFRLVKTTLAVIRLLHFMHLPVRDKFSVPELRKVHHLAQNHPAPLYHLKKLNNRHQDQRHRDLWR